jgi:AcrR family transcriptional regulator
MADDHPVPLRSRVLAAARRSFAAQGYAATSVRQLAADASTTKPMIYYYFGSKSGLFQAILEDLDARAVADFEAAAKSDLAPAEKLLAAVRSSLAQRAADPDAFAFLERARREPIAGPKDLARPITGRWAVQRDALGKILDLGVAAGTFRPIDHDLFARWFVATLDLCQFEPAPAPEEIATLLVHGLARANPPSVG